MKYFLITFIFNILILQTATGQERILNDSTEYYLSSSEESDVHIKEMVIWSEYVKDHFKLFISLPSSYHKQPLKKYPVVYFLDGGNTLFHHINSEYMKKGLIPEVITIGIGYPGTNHRNRDYTYGFNSFYKFIKYELIPHMEKTYNLNPINRTLFGHSYGGLCVLFTMFEYNNQNNILFRNLIASSPSLWYGDWKPAFARENILYEKNQVLPVNLFMGVGSMEGFMVTDLQRMQEALTDHNYTYLKMTTRVHEGKNHTTARDKSYSDGIIWIFAQDINIPTAIYEANFTQKPLVTGLYPNPVENTLNLILPTAMNAQNINCTISTINGKVVKIFNKQQPGETNLQLPVSELPKGWYLVRVSKGTETQTLKFIK